MPICFNRLARVNIEGALASLDHAEEMLEVGDAITGRLKSI